MGCTDGGDAAANPVKSLARRGVRRDRDSYADVNAPAPAVRPNFDPGPDGPRLPAVPFRGP